MSCYDVARAWPNFTHSKGRCLGLYSRHNTPYSNPLPHVVSPFPVSFIQDEREGLVGAVRNEAKAAGIPDTPEAGLEFLISRIKSNLHVVLCFSPVGDIFRIRKIVSAYAPVPHCTRFSSVRVKHASNVTLYVGEE